MWTYWRNLLAHCFLLSINFHEWWHNRIVSKVLLQRSINYNFVGNNESIILIIAIWTRIWSYSLLTTQIYFKILNKIILIHEMQFIRAIIRTNRFMSSYLKYWHGALRTTVESMTCWRKSEHWSAIKVSMIKYKINDDFEHIIWIMLK